MNSDVMNAIDLLKSQHRTIRRLFAELWIADSPEQKTRLFEELADTLAVHATIGDRQFYPAVKARKTGDELLRPFASDLNIQRVLLDLLRTKVDSESFDVKLKVLKEVVEHHVRQEEGQVFPKVKDLLGEVQLDILGRQMGREAGRIEAAGAPRLRVSTGTARPSGA